MSQDSNNGYDIPDSDGETYRLAVNASLQALASANSGATAPSTTYGGMVWLDTSSSPNVLKMRDSGDTTWIVLGVIDGSGFRPYWNGSLLNSVFATLAGGNTLTGLQAIQGGIDYAGAAAYADEIDDGNSGTSKTIDFSAGNRHKLTLTGNVTLTLTDPSGPANLVLRLEQDGTGGRTVTWPSKVKWPGGTKPTITSAAGAVDVIALYFDGTNYHAQAAQDFK